MAEILKKYFRRLREILTDQVLITDLITKSVITFGVVLIVGGLYLMIINPNGAGQISQASQSTVSIINWVPGIPFFVGELTNTGTSTVGLVSWIIGVDLLLVGLGLWIRHRLARLAAISMFGLSAFFQLVQFLYFGFLGSPTSILELFADGVIAYFLFSQYDSHIPKKLTID